MNLLIVNDEQLIAETMKKDMDWASYGISEVYTAYDTEAARACIAEHPVDILLCDIEMPGENGLGLLRWVREQEKEIECIFLTCHAKFAYAQEAISLRGTRISEKRSAKSWIESGEKEILPGMRNTEGSFFRKKFMKGKLQRALREGFSPRKPPRRFADIF